ARERATSASRVSIRIPSAAASDLRSRSYWTRGSLARRSRTDSSFLIFDFGFGIGDLASPFEGGPSAAGPGEGGAKRESSSGAVNQTSSARSRAQRPVR